MPRMVSPSLNVKTAGWHPGAGSHDGDGRREGDVLAPGGGAGRSSDTDAGIRKSDRHVHRGRCGVAGLVGCGDQYRVGSRGEGMAQIHARTIVCGRETCARLRAVSPVNRVREAGRIEAGNRVAGAGR